MHRLSNNAQNILNFSWIFMPYMDSVSSFRNWYLLSENAETSMFFKLNKVQKFVRFRNTLTIHSNLEKYQYIYIYI